MRLTPSITQGAIIQRYVERKMNLEKGVLSTSTVDFEGILTVVIFVLYFSLEMHCQVERGERKRGCFPTVKCNT